jgi:WD40 repeat protein
MTEDVSSKILLDILRSPPAASTVSRSADDATNTLKHMLFGDALPPSETPSSKDYHRSNIDISETALFKSILTTKPAEIEESKKPSHIVPGSSIGGGPAAETSTDQELSKGTGVVILKGSNLNIDLDYCKGCRSPQDLAVKSVFSLVRSDLQPDLTKKIVVNDDYICYAIKEGKVRLLRRSDGATTLLREHAAPIVDMALSNVTGDIASISEDHFLVVWNIIESSMDRVPIEGHVTLKIRGPSSHLAGPYFRRVFWHPRIEKLLAVVTMEHEILFIRLNELETDENEEIVLDTLSTSVHRVHAHSTRITAFAFSQDGSLFVTGDENGLVKIYSFTTKSLLHEFKPHKGLPISSLWLITIYPNKPSPPPLLLTGANNNRQLGLWNVATGDCIQIISFTSADELFGLIPNVIEYVDTASCLIYSCTYKKCLYVFRFNGPQYTNIRHPEFTREFDLQESLSASFDFSHCGFVRMTEFPLTMFILSFTIRKEDIDDSQDENAESLGIFCIQSKAVQHYEVPLQVLDMTSRDQTVIEGTDVLPKAEGWTKVIFEASKSITEKKGVKLTEEEPLGPKMKDRSNKLDVRKGPIEILKKPKVVSSQMERVPSAKLTTAAKPPSGQTIEGM